MKPLSQLKNELLDEDYKNLYIFTGPEYYVRNVYIERISNSCKIQKTMEEVSDIYNDLQKRSLIPRKTCYIVYDDYDYFKQPEKVLNQLEGIIGNNIVILVVNELPTSKGFETVFSGSTTIFPRISDNIIHMYAERESNLDGNFIKELSYNVDNSLGLLYTELNKIKNLSDNHNEAYSILKSKGMLPIRMELPEPDEVAYAVVTHHCTNIMNYVDRIIKLEGDILYYLPSMYNTIMMFTTFANYGPYDGGSMMYDYGMYWGKIKELRHIKPAYNRKQLETMLVDIRQLEVDVKRGNIGRVEAWDILLTSVM